MVKFHLSSSGYRLRQGHHLGRLQEDSLEPAILARFIVSCVSFGMAGEHKTTSNLLY